VRRFLASHAPTLVWSALVAALLLTPGGLDTPVPWWVERFGELGGDKVVHVALFFGQALCLGRSVRVLGGRRPGGPWVAAAVAVLYGLLLEIAQRAVPGRSYDLVDVAADAVGAAGWVVWSALRR
jgi:VanZ family protein